MNNKIQKVLQIWHKHFSNEETHYSEFESSDIEYFVGCLLYNHFAYTKALDTMKTIDLSYDFLESCGDEYDDIIKIIKTIKIEDEKEKIEFLQDFIKEAKKKYSEDALYLLNRLEYHVDGVMQRFIHDEETKKVNFVAPKPRPVNPLLR